ncbi:DUF4167 domain-containing protein [Thalassospira lucentensis]|uniref:DUF4167 domain-containing protein n=1 Tax=Thalassospira lucentensis TaxID=168935 RepID=UPI00142DD8CA|nr:DUF4167 domain-containing protein [Thalassospira lucentensis]NIZ02655.1 DUF4167 domain-containing protein [Thalassospira lucentensis]
MRNNNKRPRGRQQPNKRPVNPKFQNFDSNGPDGRVRGNAQQVHEKYVSLAKDCTDDPVLAENYYQHAEHYYRILQAAQEWENQRREERGGDNSNNNNNRQRNQRNNRDDRGDNQPNQRDGQGANTETVAASDDAANGAPNSDNTNRDNNGGDNASQENTVAASADGGEEKPKRAPRARRTDARRPRKPANADAAPASDDVIAVAGANADAPAEIATPAAAASDADNAAPDASTDAGQDGEEKKKPRRAAAGTARTRGRHPTARRGRSRAAGREDGEGGDASSDEGTEPVSA